MARFQDYSPVLRESLSIALFVSHKTGYSDLLSQPTRICQGEEWSFLDYC